MNREPIMLKHFPIYIIILCACAQVMLSCAEEESWTSDASARLEFSVDSVVFDTLLSTVPSATRTLTVYNRNADGVRLPLVRLLQGGETFSHELLSVIVIENDQTADQIGCCQDDYQKLFHVMIPFCGIPLYTSFPEKHKWSAFPVMMKCLIEKCRLIWHNN